MRMWQLVTIAFVGMGVASYVTAKEAHAQQAACSAREVTLYFEKDGVAVNAASRAIVEKLAADAKACGAKDVIVDAPNGALERRRASAIESAFRQQGVTATLVLPATLEPKPVVETVLDRAARVRISPTISAVT